MERAHGSGVRRSGGNPAAERGIGAVSVGVEAMSAAGLPPLREPAGRSLWRWAAAAGLMVVTTLPESVAAVGATKTSAGSTRPAGSSASSAVEEFWSPKLPEFRADAPVDGKVTLLYFTATWCGYCDQMDRTTLSNRDVRARLGTVGRVKLDYDQQPELVAKYRIRGVPAFLLVDTRGEEVARTVGAANAEMFAGWLDAGRARGLELAKAAARRQAELKKLAVIVNMEGDAAWDDTKALVFDLAARGETESREFALKQLALRAESYPESLREGLLHPDLAVRIAVAGVLRKQLGERFVFDPWAHAEERAAAVAQLGDDGKVSDPPTL